MMTPPEKLEKATPESQKEGADLEHQTPSFADLSLIQVSTILYTTLATIGALIALYGQQNLLQILAIPEEQSVMVKLLTISALASGLLLIASYLFEGWFPSFQNIKNTMTMLLGPTSTFAAFYLAFVSALGEELFFRAGVQPYAGLIVTSCLFGLLHLGPDGQISAWSLWALVAGLLLGWMYEATASLWPPLITHFTVNTVSILRLQRLYRHRVALLESKALETVNQETDIKP